MRRGILSQLFETGRKVNTLNMGLVNGADVAEHSSSQSCWIVLDSNVYDVTSFLKSHPGGAAIILKQAGTASTTDTVYINHISY